MGWRAHGTAFQVAAQYSHVSRHGAPGRPTYTVLVLNSWMPMNLPMGRQRGSANGWMIVGMGQAPCGG
jgi:hypothetical protein